jgi:hypothetical protein
MDPIAEFKQECADVDRRRAANSAARRTKANAYAEVRAAAGADPKKHADIDRMLADTRAAWREAEAALKKAKAAAEVERKKEDKLFSRIIKDSEAGAAAHQEIGFFPAVARKMKGGANYKKSIKKSRKNPKKSKKSKKHSRKKRRASRKRKSRK